MFGESLERVQLPGLPSVGDIRKGVEQTRQYTNGAIFPQIHCPRCRISRNLISMSIDGLRRFKKLLQYWVDELYVLYGR
jgi:hypothetical protein